MKQHHSNYMLFITIIGLLTASTILLNYKDKIRAEAPSISVIKNPVDELTLEKAYASLQHLMASRSVSTIVQMLHGVTIDRALSLAQMMLSSKSSALTREDKAQIILGLVHNNSADIKKQYQLLDMLKQFRDLKKDKPILVSAVHSQYSDVISVILAWMKERHLDEPSIMNAFTYATLHNDVAGFTKLHAHAVPMTSAQATQLLLQTVIQQKMFEFIPLLVDLGADIDTPHQGKTPLMLAVFQNNIGMIEALLKAGAAKNINKFIDSSIGTALQLAIEKGYTDIELMLREHGARE